MDNKTWFAVHIEAAFQATEAIEFALNSLEALGTEVIDLPKQDREIITVTGYFDLLPDAKLLQDELENGLSIYGLPLEAIVSITTDEIENTDWLAEWKRHWKPTEVGRFVIAAPWHELDETDKIVIRIEPNMAFGTGTHETTQLCLEALDKHLHSNNSFLDVGTGTGILAIAASKLAPQRVARILAIDNDPHSVTIAQENGELNGVSDSVQFEVGSIHDDTPEFDVVCANLTIDVIEPILPALLQKTNRVLILSGILFEQKTAIVRLLTERGVLAFTLSHSGEWIAVTVDNASANAP